MTLHRWSRSSTELEREAVMLLAESCHIGAHGNLGKLLAKGHAILDTLAPLYASPTFYLKSKLKPNTLVALIEGGWDILSIFVKRGSQILDFLASSTPLPLGNGRGPATTWDVHKAIEGMDKASISTAIRDQLIMVANRAYSQCWGSRATYFGHEYQKAEEAQAHYLKELLNGILNAITSNDMLSSELEIKVRKMVASKATALLCNSYRDTGGQMLAYGPGMLPNLDGGVPLLCPAFVTWMAEMLKENAFAINLISTWFCPGISRWQSLYKSKAANVPWTSTSGGLIASLTHWLFYKTEDVSEPWDKPDASRMLNATYKGMPGSYYLDTALFGVIKLVLGHRLTILNPSTGDLERLHTSCPWMPSGASKVTPSTLEEAEMQSDVADQWNKGEMGHGPFVTRWQISIKDKHRINLPQCSARMGLVLDSQLSAALGFMVKEQRMSKKVWQGLRGTPLDFMGVTTNRVNGQAQLVTALVGEMAWREARMPTFFDANPAWAWLLAECLRGIRAVPGFEHYCVWENFGVQDVLYEDEPITADLLSRIQISTAKSEGRKKLDSALSRFLEALNHAEVAGIPVKVVKKKKDGRKAGKPETHWFLHPEVARMSLLLRNKVLDISHSNAETRLNEDCSQPHHMDRVGERMIGVPRDCAVQVLIAPPKAVHQFYTQTAVPLDDLDDMLMRTTQQVDEEEDSTPEPEEERAAFRSMHVEPQWDDEEGAGDDLEAMERDGLLSDDDEDVEPGGSRGTREAVLRRRVWVDEEPTLDEDGNPAGLASPRQTSDDVFMADEGDRDRADPNDDSMDVDSDAVMDYEQQPPSPTPVYPPRAHPARMNRNAVIWSDSEEDVVRGSDRRDVRSPEGNSGDDGDRGSDEPDSGDRDKGKGGYSAGSESEGRDEGTPSQISESEALLAGPETPPLAKQRQDDASPTPAVVPLDSEGSPVRSLLAKVAGGAADPENIVDDSQDELLSPAPSLLPPSGPPPTQATCPEPDSTADVPAPDPQPVEDHVVKGLPVGTSSEEPPADRPSDEEVISDSQSEFSPLAPSAIPLPSTTQSAEPLSPDLSGVIAILGSMAPSQVQQGGTGELRDLISIIHNNTPPEPVPSVDPPVGLEPVPATDVSATRGQDPVMDRHTSPGQGLAVYTPAPPAPVPTLDPPTTGVEIHQGSPIEGLPSMDHQIETAASQVQMLSISRYPISNARETAELAEAINRSFADAHPSTHGVDMAGPMEKPSTFRFIQGPSGRSDDDELDYSNEDDDMADAIDRASAPKVLVPATPSGSDSESSLGKRRRSGTGTGPTWEGAGESALSYPRPQLKRSRR